SRVLQFPLLIDQTFRGLVDDAADQQLTDFLENDLARTQHVALARERLACKPVGQEGQAYSIIANRLDSRGRVGWRRRRGFAGGIKLIRMQPDDQGQPAAEIVAASRADQMGGRVFLLHAGQREQSFALGLVQLDGGVWRQGQFHGLDLVVRDECARGKRRAKGDSVLVDARDFGRDDVAAAQVQRLALAAGLSRLIAAQRREKTYDETAGALRRRRRPALDRPRRRRRRLLVDDASRDSRAQGARGGTSLWLPDQAACPGLLMAVHQPAGQASSVELEHTRLSPDGRGNLRRTEHDQRPKTIKRQAQGLLDPG